MSTENKVSPAQPGAINGAPQAGAKITTADLESALMGASPSAVAEPDDAPPSPAAGDPAVAPETPPDDHAGQTSETEEPPAEGTEPDGAAPEADGEQTVLSQTGDGELDTALAKLTPAMRKHVVAVSELLGNGALSSGEIPRIGQLLHERHEMAQTIEGLKQELETAKATPPATADAPSALPETVAKLKTPGEVKARQVQAREAIRALEDFLEENPEGGEIGGKPVSRRQAVAAKRSWEDELAVLPERAAQLQQDAALSQARQQSGAALVKEFPVLNDPQNPITQTFRQLAKLPQFQREPNGDELAYLLARGHAVVQAERAASGKNGAAAAPKPGVKPAGKVPLGKPHNPSAAAAAKPGEAMERFNRVATLKPGERVTNQKLEDVLAHLPVGR